MNYKLRLARLTAEQQVAFYQQFEDNRMSDVAALWLCLFAGAFGIHKFYMKEYIVGVLYVLFFWTGIPFILSLIDLFRIKGQISRINSNYANLIINQIIAKEEIL